MQTFFTIGYQAFSPSSFIDQLQEHKIDLLLDVRDNPFSFQKGFSKTPLRILLEKFGIEYQHRKEMGTPPNIRSMYKATGDPSKALLLYEQHLSKHFELVDSLISLINSRRVCLLCLESDHNLCHRSVIAGRIKERMKWSLVNLKAMD